MVYLTRRERFNAAHRLFQPALSQDENKTLFGKCANANFHGHNYDLLVTVKGTPDPQTGFIVNAHQLSKVIQSEIIDRVDHKNLNLDVDFMEGILPSTENFLIAIWNQLKPHIVGCTLHCIKLVETENIYAEYYGE